MAGFWGRSALGVCHNRILHSLEFVLLNSLRQSIERNALFPGLLLARGFEDLGVSDKKVLGCGGNSLFQRGYTSALVQLEDEAKPHSEELKPGQSVVQEAQIGNHSLVWKTGKLARLADAACVCGLGGTEVLATVVCDRSQIQQTDMVPLQVEYREKLSSVGRIPSTFNRREGPPKEREILAMRAVDRAIRPLFPKGFCHETQIVASVLSADGTQDPDILAINATSAALMLSNIPWDGPIGAVRIGYVGGEFVVNPSVLELAGSKMNLTFAGNMDQALMIECQAKEVDDEDFAEALRIAQAEVQKLIIPQKKLASRGGQPKRKFVSNEPGAAIVKHVMEIAEPLMKKGYNENGDSKAARSNLRNLVLKQVKKSLGFTDTKIAEDSIVLGLDRCTSSDLEASLDKVEAKVVRDMILRNGIRVDGRESQDLRPVHSEVECLQIVHGSALFQRGETQCLCTATVGGDHDVYEDKAILGESSKHLMLHYGFPPFATCEISKTGGQSRREIGHGNLAERALLSVMPDSDSFPFPVRLVAETMSSNGSSSMAAVCSGALALKNAGVPIKDLVAGVSIGLVTDTPVVPPPNVSQHLTAEGIGKRVLLVDLQGLEDHHGDMDFKIAGTGAGITAVQLDVKLPGISLDILVKALPLATAARRNILDIMDKSLLIRSGPLSPKFGTIEINKDLVGHVIGEGGETIRRIESDSGARIIIKPDSNELRVYAPTQAQYNQAETAILDVQGANIREGEVYTVRVVRIMDFGAFVELPSGFQTLLHISEISHMRIRAIEDVLHEGQELKVKCLGRDPKGNVRISRKALQPIPRSAH